jgi:hypothetical protein
MKALLLVFLILCVSTFSLRAQNSVYLMSGYTRNTLAGTGKGFYEKASARGGYSISVSYRSRIYRRLETLVGLEVLQKNFSSHDASEVIYLYQRNTYISVPLLFPFRLLTTKRLEIEVMCGPSFGYWAFRISHGTIPDAFTTTFTTGPDGQVHQTVGVASYSSKNSFVPDSDRRFELSGVLGLQVSTPVSKKVQLAFRGSYIRSFTPIEKKSNVPRNVNETSVFSAGIKYNLWMP